MSMDNMKHSERTIRIADNVLQKVAAISAKDVSGVAGLAEDCPVNIINLGGAISAEIFIFVKNDTRAAAVALRVQQAVKQCIQDMTGVTAVNVHVNICGIRE